MTPDREYLLNKHRAELDDWWAEQIRETEVEELDMPAETPDLPIPEAAIEELAEAIYLRHDAEPLVWDFEYPAVREEFIKTARLVVAATLPHLRSLQVETQVEYGRQLGRKEALDDVGRGLGCVLQTHETYVDIQMDAGLWRDIAATRDADRKLAVDDRSLQERQNLLRVPTHDIDGNRIPEWEREYIARDIGKGDPNG